MVEVIVPPTAAKISFSNGPAMIRDEASLHSRVKTFRG